MILVQGSKVIDLMIVDRIKMLRILIAVLAIIVGYLYWRSPAGPFGAVIIITMAIIVLTFFTMLFLAFKK